MAASPVPSPEKPSLDLLFARTIDLFCRYYQAYLLDDEYVQRTTAFLTDQLAQKMDGLDRAAIELFTDLEDAGMPINPVLTPYTNAVRQDRGQPLRPTTEMAK